MVMDANLHILSLATEETQPAPRTAQMAQHRTLGPVAPTAVLPVDLSSGDCCHVENHPSIYVIHLYI